MISAKLQGRRLVLTVETEPDEEAIPPFYVTALSARAGRELSTRYLFAVEGLPVEEGSVSDDVVESFGLENYTRADETLSQAEGELLAQAAYFWQTVGGIEAVRALLEVIDGEQGTVDAKGKALGVFRLRMVPLLSQIRHRLESALQTREESTPATDIPSGSDFSGSKPEQQPSEPQPAATTAKPGPPRESSPATNA